MGSHGLDLHNQKFGKLTALSRRPPASDPNAVIWECKCDCGRTVEVASHDLVTGHRKSCGCARKESYARRSKVSPERARELIASGKTLNQVAKELGVTRQAIHYRI